METQALPQLHAISVVSIRTSLSRSAIYREITSGRLRAVKIGKSVRVTEEDLQVFIASLQSAKAI